MACLAFTLEWRGMLDTDPVVSAADASALIGWLGMQGVVNAAVGMTRNQVVDVTPLAGVEVVTAPQPGLFLAELAPGTPVLAGTILGRLHRLPDGTDITLTARVDGLLYAREQTRIVHAGAELFFIAGCQPIRNGMLLSA